MSRFLATRLLFTALITATGMFIYEAIKQLVSPQITIWQSHCVTISFSTLIATTATFFALQRYERLKEQASRQIVALTHSEKQLRLQGTALNAVGNGIVITDAAGNICWVNRAFSVMTGYSAEEVRGQNPRFLKSGKQDAAFFREMWAALAKGSVWHGELINRRIDGALYTEEMTIAPVPDENGRTSHYVAIKQDISARKQVEAQLAAAKLAAEDSNRAKDSFLAILGHELRNPLAPIRNSIHMLKHSSPSQSTLARAHDMIERQVVHLARLLEDLLDLSRISYGKIQLKKEPVELAAFLRTFVRDFEFTCNSAEVSLETSLPEGPLWVFGDPARLQQIFGNLLNNAVKFTDRGGKASLSLAAENPGHVLFVVQDNGMGMEPGMLAHAFEPFQQAGQNLGRNRSGLGLGLALVKGLTELHGGSVWVESGGLGKGTKVSVRLPMENQIPIKTSPATSGAAKHSHRILIVEDNADAAESLRLLLTILAHEAIVARTGEEGVKLAFEFKPDVVICDIDLPGMDGYAVAGALRAAPEIRAARLIAMTGYGQEEDHKHAERAGFDHHITKPADPEMLEQLLSA